MKKFTEPERARNADGKTKPPECKIYEPHEWNALLLKRQRKLGLRANIPQVPSLGQGHTIAIKAPVMRDPRTLIDEPADVLPDGPDVGEPVE